MNVTLKKHIKMLLKERQRALELQFASSQKQVDAAADALQYKLSTMNELRSDFERRVGDLERYQANMTGRLWMLGIGLGILIGVLEFLLRR